MSHEAEHAIFLVKWWQELTALLVALLTLFGIFRSKSRKTLVTTDHLDAVLSKHAEDIKQSIRDVENKVYERMDQQNHHLTERIDDILNNK